MKSAKAFISHLRSNPELQTNISSADWSVDSVVAAGKAAGFTFTGDEYRAAYGELAEAELSAVTGGAQCTPVWKGGASQL
ncbi:MAG: Nif11-like leader peptide family natural product precursor [Myxococcota bacterium]